MRKGKIEETEARGCETEIMGRRSREEKKERKVMSDKRTVKGRNNEEGSNLEVDGRENGLQENHLQN